MTVNLTKIYTRLGDDGETHLGDMSRVPKVDARIEAYGTVDELNAQIGVAVTVAGMPEQYIGWLRHIQNDLFDVGADLCTPVIDEPKHEPLRVTQPYIDFLEQACDEFNGRLTPLRSFVLPGGTPAAAGLHVARTVIRRAERSTWAALDTYHGGMNPLTATYRNRLSDLLFILSRLANLSAGGDVLWEPGRHSKLA